MSTHNVCFRRELRQILCGYPLLSGAMCLFSLILIYVVRATDELQRPYFQNIFVISALYFWWFSIELLK